VEQAQAAGEVTEPAEDDDDVAPEAEAGAPSPDDEEAVLECARCEVELRFLGTKKFHEGAHLGIIGEVGHLFENSESFDVYVCPSCGHVDFFVDGIGEDSRPE
jgi:hypothetical protein